MKVYAIWWQEIKKIKVLALIFVIFLDHRDGVLVAAELVENVTNGKNFVATTYR